MSENKSEKQIVEKKKEVTEVTYTPANQLKVEDIVQFKTVDCLFIPQVKRIKNNIEKVTYTYQFDLVANGLKVNSLGDNMSKRVNLDSSEYQAIRLFNNKLSDEYNTKSFTAKIFYRYVKGQQTDGTMYYSVQYWLAPHLPVKVKFFESYELSILKHYRKNGNKDIMFVEKPIDVVEVTSVGTLFDDEEDL